MLPLRMTREMVMTKNGNPPFFIYLSILYYCTFQENRHNRHLFVHNLFFKQGYIISPGHTLVPEPIPGRVMVRQIRKLQIRKENTNCTLQPRLLQYHCTYPLSVRGIVPTQVLCTTGFAAGTAAPRQRIYLISGAPAGRVCATAANGILSSAVLFFTVAASQGNMPAYVFHS